MGVVRRYRDEQRRVIWVATDRQRWHVWWGTDGGPYQHEWPADETATRELVAGLRHRDGGTWRDITTQPGPG